jgi:histone H2B
MSKKRPNPSTLGGDTPEKEREGSATPTEVSFGKDKDAESAGKKKDAESAGKCKDSTPTSQVGKDKDAASSAGEEPGKYPLGVTGKKKKEGATPTDTPEDAPLAPASSPVGSGGTVQTSSHLSGRTQLSEDGELKSKGKDKSPSIGGPSEDLKPLRRRGRVGGARALGGASGTPSRMAKVRSQAQSKRNARLKKVVKKGQAKHARSFSTYIMKILKDVDPTKKMTSQAMMIHDSFANDLCDKIIAAATQLVATAKIKQLGSAQIIAAVKLVLPPDMSRDAQKCIEASVKAYKETSSKWQEQIKDVDKLKEKIKGDSTPK